MNDIERMCRAHFNEPVLVMFEVARLVGYAEDEQDYYLLLRYTNPHSNRLVWHTAVGGYTFLTCLKGTGVVYSNNDELWNDFTRLDNMLSLNGAETEEEFKVIYHSSRSGA